MFLFGFSRTKCCMHAMGGVGTCGGMGWPALPPGAGLGKKARGAAPGAEAGVGLVLVLVRPWPGPAPAAARACVTGRLAGVVCVLQEGLAAHKRPTQHVWEGRPKPVRSPRDQHMQ